MTLRNSLSNFDKTFTGLKNNSRGQKPLELQRKNIGAKILYPLSSILYPLSSILYPLSSILYPKAAN